MTGTRTRKELFDQMLKNWEKGCTVNQSASEILLAMEQNDLLTIRDLCVLVKILARSPIDRDHDELIAFLERIAVKPEFAENSEVMSLINQLRIYVPAEKQLVEESKTPLNFNVCLLSEEMLCTAKILSDMKLDSAHEIPDLRQYREIKKSLLRIYEMINQALGKNKE